MVKGARALGRLKGRNLGSRLAAPKAARLPVATRAKRSATEAPWRALYAKAQWQRLRVEILTRDGFVCRQTGVALIGAPGAWNSPVVDHITPAHEFWWDGRRALFWDPDNLQSVAKRWHDTEKQRQERRARDGWGGVDL